MVIKNVYVIWTHPLFHVSIRALLDHPEIELIGSSSDWIIALEEIAESKPEIIIIEEDDLEINTSINLMVNLGSNHPDYHIIGLNINDNKLNVFHHQEQKVMEVDDLMRLVLNKS